MKFRNTILSALLCFVFMGENTVSYAQVKAPNWVNDPNLIMKSYASGFLPAVAHSLKEESQVEDAEEVAKLQAMEQIVELANIEVDPNSLYAYAKSNKLIDSSYPSLLAKVLLKDNVFTPTVYESDSAVWVYYKIDTKAFFKQLDTYRTDRSYLGYQYLLDGNAKRKSGDLLGAAVSNLKALENLAPISAMYMPHEDIPDSVDLGVATLFVTQNIFNNLKLTPVFDTIPFIPNEGVPCPVRVKVSDKALPVKDILLNATIAGTESEFKDRERSDAKGVARFTIGKVAGTAPSQTVKVSVDAVTLNALPTSYLKVKRLLLQSLSKVGTTIDLEAFNPAPMLFVSGDSIEEAYFNSQCQSIVESKGFVLTRDSLNSDLICRMESTFANDSVWKSKDYRMCINSLTMKVVMTERRNGKEVFNYDNRMKTMTNYSRSKEKQYATAIREMMKPFSLELPENLDKSTFDIRNYKWLFMNE